MKTILVVGDAQAGAIALTLRAVEPLAGKVTVEYLTADEFAKDLPDRLQRGVAVAFVQMAEGESRRVQMPWGTKVVRFPTLALNLLWPFTSMNAANRPEPPRFPSGRFPYGDAVLESCLRQGVSPETALQLYLGTEWDDSWPNLEQFLRSERARLLGLDRQFDLGIGDFILKNFQTRPLFWNVHSPADATLAELIRQLADKGFGDGQIPKREIVEAMGGLGSRDILGNLAVPIHPTVAKVYGLEWYASTKTYNHFDGAALTYAEYFKAYVAQATRPGDSLAAER